MTTGKGVRSKTKLAIHQTIPPFPSLSALPPPFAISPCTFNDPLEGSGDQFTYFPSPSTVVIDQPFTE